MDSTPPPELIGLTVVIDSFGIENKNRLLIGTVPTYTLSYIQYWNFQWEEVNHRYSIEI